MFDSYLISLGIGSPASIGYLITFGLKSAEVTLLPTPRIRTYYVQAEVSKGSTDPRTYHAVGDDYGDI